MPRVCAICGRSESEVKIYDGLCPICFIVERLEVKVKRRPRIAVCPSCGDHTFRGRWRRDYDGRKIADDLAVMVSDVVRVEGGVFKGVKLDEEVDLEKLYSRPSDLRVGVFIYLEGYEEDVTYHFNVPLKVDVRLCDRCIRERSGNYEAVLQVRMVEGPMSMDRRKQVYRIVVESLGKAYREGRDYRVVKTEDYRYGIDIYFTSYSQAMRVAQALKKRIGGVISETSKLVKIDRSGRRVARKTILIRLVE